MVTFDEHTVLLKRLWNLTPETLDALRVAANAAPAPDPGFALVRLEQLQAAGQDPVVVVGELIARGPSIIGLMQLAQYITHAGGTEVTLPEGIGNTPVAATSNNSDTAQPPLVMSIKTLSIAALVLLLHNFTRQQLETTDITLTHGMAQLGKAPYSFMVIVFTALRHIFDNGIDEVCCLMEADDGAGVATLSRKDVSRMLNSLLNPLDQHMMMQGAVLIMTMHALRASYALATDIDEVAYFAHGSVVMTLDDILGLMLEYSLQLPDCLFGLANQIFQRRLQWREMRGRLTNAYDLLSMIPDAIALQEVEEDPSEVAQRIDKAPRGRVMRFWRYKWMDVGSSLLLIAGGIVAYKKANASFAATRL